jgi:exopolysaccharide production protein ExoZ
LQQPSLSQSRRIVSIQVCRGLAALLVVLAHLRGVEAKYCATGHMRLFEHGALGVDLFFVISGVVIASVTSGKSGHPRNAVTFLYHRIARIFPIFWIYNTLSLLAHHFAGIGESPEQGRFSLLASYLLIPTHAPIPLLQAWTLSYELYFYLIVFLLLLLVPQRIAPWLLAIWGIAVVALKLHLGFSPDPFIQLLISPAVLEFLAGCLIFHIYRRSRLHKTIGVLLVLISALWLAAIVVYTLHAHPGQPEWIANQPWQRPLLYGTFATLLLLGAMELERTGLIHFLPLLKSIGDWSYSIYLSHVLVLELIGHLAHRFHATILVIDLISLPAVLFVGYLSHIYLERPLMNLLYKPGPPPPTSMSQKSHINLRAKPSAAV